MGRMGDSRSPDTRGWPLRELPASAPPPLSWSAQSATMKGLSAAATPGTWTVMDTKTEESMHPDLPEEQAYLDRVYECLEDMRQQAARGARIVVAGAFYQASWDDTLSSHCSIPALAGARAGR